MVNSRLGPRRSQVARLKLAFVQRAMFTMLSLGTASVRAAGSESIELPQIPAGPAVVAQRSNDYEVAATDGKLPNVSLDAAIASNTNPVSKSFVLNASLLGSAMSLSGVSGMSTDINSVKGASHEWSRPIKNCSGLETKLLDSDQERYWKTQGRPLFVFHKRFRVSRFTFSRNRIQLVLALDF